MVWFMTFEIALSERLFLFVLPLSRALKWSCPSVRFITCTPFLDLLTLNRLAVALCVFSLGIMSFFKVS